MSDLGILPPSAPSTKETSKKSFFSKLFKKQPKDSLNDLPSLDDELGDYKPSESLDDKTFDLADIEKKISGNEDSNNNLNSMEEKSIEEKVDDKKINEDELVEKQSSIGELPEIPEPSTTEKDVHEMIHSTLDEPRSDVSEEPDFDFTQEAEHDFEESKEEVSESDFVKDPEELPSFEETKENVKEDISLESDFTKEVDDTKNMTGAVTNDLSEEVKEDFDWTNHEEQSKEENINDSEFDKDVPIEKTSKKKSKNSAWLKEAQLEIKKEEEAPKIEAAPPELVEHAVNDLKPLIDEHDSLKEEISKLAKSSKVKLPDSEHPFEKATQTDKTFFVRDGVELKSVKDLIRALNVMDDDTFEHHVNKQRNDFSNWVKHVFKQKKLAKDMLTAKTRFELLDVLYDHSNKHEEKISKNIQKIVDKKEEVKEHLAQVEGLHEQLDAMQVLLGEKHKLIADNHKEIEDKIHAKVKDYVNLHLKEHHENLKKESSNLKKELNKTKKERERIVKNAKKLDEKIRNQHQQTKEELEKQKQLILKERTEAFKLKNQHEENLDKLQKMFSEDHKNLQKQYSDLQKKLEKKYSKEQVDMQKHYSSEEKKLSKKYSVMFDKLEAEKSKIAIQKQEALELVKQAKEVKKLKSTNKKELTKLSELRKSLNQKERDLEKQAVHLRDKNKSLGEHENELAKKEADLNNQEHNLVNDKEEFAQKMAASQREAEVKNNALYVEYENMAKSRDEDFNKKSTEKEELLNNWEKELKAKQDSFNNEFKLFKKEESKFKNYVKQQNAAIAKKKDAIKKEMKKLDKKLADKAQVAKYIEEAENAVHKHEVTNYLGEKLQEIKHSNAQELLENAEAGASIELYAMIDECKSFLEDGNLKSAKALYNKIRSEYSKADLVEVEKGVLYDSIRDLYEQIQVIA